MVVIRLSGGLGNQMFQYAFYLKLRALGREACFDDISGYEHQAETGVVRPVQLSVFGIDYPKCNMNEVVRLRDADMAFSSRVRRKLTGRKSLEISDRDFVFDPGMLDKNEAYFTGCFQSPEYFAGIEDKVRAVFTFPDNMPGLTDEIRAMAARMETEKSVSVHMRFGDYLAKQETYGGICTTGYYHSAMRLFADETDADFSGHSDTNSGTDSSQDLQPIEQKVHFYIFSNDTLRAQQTIDSLNLPDNISVVMMKDRSEDEGYLDLYLMAHFRKHIIANSSFSWWGAFLSGSHSVIAPTPWIHCSDGSDLARDGIYTKEMIRINPRGDVTGKYRPLVTVIVALFNIEKYAATALNSVLAQTYDNLEIIAVDDGSTDGTGRICDEYAARDKRIKVIHKENGGLSDARNAGLDVMTGDFVCYLDGDDRMEPEMVEAMVTAAIKSGADIATCGYREVYENTASSDGGTITKEALVKQVSQFTARDIKRIVAGSILSDSHKALEIYLCADTSKRMIYNSVWSKLFRKKIAEGIRFQKGKNSEDILYTARTFVRAESVVVLREPLYCYLQDRGGSIMNERLGERRIKDEIPNWLEQIKCFEENDLPDIADRARFILYRHVIDYDCEFSRDQEMKHYSAELEKFMDGQKDRVLHVASLPWVPSGDRRKLENYVKSPAAYVKKVLLYEKTVVPVKRAVKRLTGAVRWMWDR